MQTTSKGPHNENAASIRRICKRSNQRENVHVAIFEALELITTEDMFGFYSFIL